MPRALQRTFKYKCLEVLCNTVHRQDKWVEHCKKKHTYKLKNNLNIKYKIIEFREGNNGQWKRCSEPEEVVNWTRLQVQVEDTHKERTANKDER